MREREASYEARARLSKTILNPALKLVLRRYEKGDADYSQALALRTKVLREPLGLTYDPKDLAREGDDVHLGAFVDEKLVGCLILTKLDERVAKMRQVAVAPAMQGLGVGRRLVEKSEEIAHDLGFTEIALNARETAVPFYLALGYAVVGEPFTEVGLPHKKMIKSLQSKANEQHQ